MLMLKCTKIDFGWGSARPRWGNLQRSLRPLAGFKGPISKGRGYGKGGEGGRGRGREGVGRRGGRVRRGRDPVCIFKFSLE